MLLAYITKKPHRATDGVFCYPLKGLNATCYVSLSIAWKAQIVR